jgi:hypothetical protein
MLRIMERSILVETDSKPVGASVLYWGCGTTVCK